MKNSFLMGLSNGQADGQRIKYGKNELPMRKKRGVFLSWLHSFNDPIIKILLIALGFNLAIMFKYSNLFETLGIGVAVLIATGISTLSEYSSEKTFEKLMQENSKVSARVHRNAGVVLLPSLEIVAGDVVLLSAGDKIPADGFIVSGQVYVDQSTLNGEVKEALKKEMPLSDAELSALIEMENSKPESDLLHAHKVFAGTSIMQGDGIMVVTSVGEKTFYGRLAVEVQEDKRISPLKLRLSTLAKRIGLWGYIGAAFVAVAYLFNLYVVSNQFVWVDIVYMLSDLPLLLTNLIKAVTLAVTVVVMAVPEGLPMMITVVLSSQMKRLLKSNVLVKKLVGIETAGSMNILFTDKTGTLTQGKPQAVKVLLGNGDVRDATSSLPQLIKERLAAGLLNNTGCNESKGMVIGGNATDRALFTFAKILNTKVPKGMVLQQIPFDSAAKFSAVTVDTGGIKTTYIKGAPEIILASCTYYLNEHGQRQELKNKKLIEDKIKEFSSKCMRLIAVAESMNDVQFFKNLTLTALIGIRDELRPEAADGVAKLKRAGIQVVMITGDAKDTATAIAKDAGIVKAGTDVIITSAELNRLTDTQVAKLLPNLRVVARALPQDKSRLVRIAQSKNLVAGMTGDGVNDAPALKIADVGFAMGSGTEVAKEAADVVIINDNIQSITNAVSFGRTIFKTIQKFVVFQLTVNFCAVGVSIIGPFIGINNPITIIQMLWINLVMDTLGGLAFGGESPRRKYMEEPPKSRTEPILTKTMWMQISILSVYCTLLAIAFLKIDFVQLSFIAKGESYAMTAFFALFMFLAIFISFNVRTDEINILDYISLNKNFITIMGAVSCLQILFIYFGGTVFRTVGLTFMHFLFVIILAATVIPFEMMRKMLFAKLKKTALKNKKS